MPSTSGKPRGSLAGLFGAAKPPKSTLDDKEALAKSLRASISMPFSVLQPAPDHKENLIEKGFQGKESANVQNGEHQVLPAPTHQPQPAIEAGLAAADKEKSQMQTDPPSQSVQGVEVTEEHHARGETGVGAQGEGEDGAGSGRGEEEHLGMVPGASVGLPVMDYVPISINEMKRAARKSKAEGGGGKKGKQKQGDGPQSISQNTLPRKDKDALKRKYIMGLEHEDMEGSEDEEGAQTSKKQRRAQSGQGGSKGGRQGGKHGVEKRRSSHQARVAADAIVDDSDSSSSDNGDDDGDGDDVLRAGSFMNPLTKHKHKAGSRPAGAEPANSDSDDRDGPSGHGHEQAGGVVAFDYAAATEQANKVEKARVRRLAQQQAAAGDRGRGRGRQQQQRGAGGRGGKRPAFNPYHIPDENLMKAGKRSTVMPRSGNRTMTFK